MPNRLRLYPLAMTAVYRLYDVLGRLIYVGIASDFDKRFAQHRQFKDWWPQVARKDVIWFDNRYDALYEEAWAIETEGPVYNEKVGADPIGLMVIHREPYRPCAGPRGWNYPVPERKLLLSRYDKAGAWSELVRHGSHAMVAFEAEPIGVAVPMEWYMRARKHMGLAQDISDLPRADPEVLLDGRRTLGRATVR